MEIKDTLRRKFEDTDSGGYNSYGVMKSCVDDDDDDDDGDIYRANEENKKCNIILFTHAV